MLWRATYWLAAALLCVIVLACSLEAAVEFLLRYPQSAPALFRPAREISHLKNYYSGFDRSIVQFRHDCAQYDERLIYRLRSGGSCVVRNRESTTLYTMNGAGLRDSDDKLLDPTIIVLGDSQAMGWGVSAEDTLASRLGSLTGSKVLNAAISSYDTGREVELLRELIGPATKYVVIAYCDNDYTENWESVRSGSVPHVDRAAYEGIVDAHERAVRYYPFKHLWNLGQSVVQSVFAQQPAARLLERPAFAAMMFVALLDRHAELFRGRHLIVFEANSYDRNSPQFATYLRRAAARSDLLRELSSMHVIDTSSFLTDDDYFLIDDHLRPSGHEKIAHALASVIKGDSRWRVDATVNAVRPSQTDVLDGRVDSVERKGALSIIYGSAARQNTGEPAAAVALLRNGVTLVESEPVLKRDYESQPAIQSVPTHSGFALAFRSDRVAASDSLEVVGIWPGNHVERLAGQTKLLEK